MIGDQPSAGVVQDGLAPWPRRPAMPDALGAPGNPASADAGSPIPSGCSRKSGRNLLSTLEFARVPAPLTLRRHESSLRLPVTLLRISYVERRAFVHTPGLRWLAACLESYCGPCGGPHPRAGTSQYINVGGDRQTAIIGTMQSRAGSQFKGPQELTVDEGHAGQRIDNFLITRLKGLPRTRIYRILRRGEVRVNKGRIRQHYRLKTGDVVRIPPLALEPRPLAEKPGQPLLERLEGRILYEDRGLIALDKPSGIAVHGGSGRSYGVIEAMRAARPADRALELVHRLDRDTSGCLLLAKRRAVLKALHDAFRHGRVDKRYLLLVKGRWRGGPCSVRASLRKNQSRSGERVVKVTSAGKVAETRFVPLVVGPEASLLEAQPVTGRTHQIRVHAASVGHPVAGDPKYGERDFNRGLREHGLRRLFLHAVSLDLPNPTTGEALHVQAPVPEDLQAALACLGLDDVP